VPITRLLLEYDGAPFAGWAVQPDGRSVQAEVELALATLLRRETPLTVAGRTDAGVHAWGQVASYEGERARLRGLNALLPDEIVALASERAPDGFDARRDALSRTYCYRIFTRTTPSAFERGRALWWPRPLDQAALDAYAAALIGKHDFSAFTPSETNHHRFEREVMRARFQRRGDILELWIEAASFLRHMNRILVGTMLELVGAGTSPQDFAALLEGRPRSEAGRTAPAHGLYLAGVRFEDRSGGEGPPRLPLQA
jgi:tRNA pseudouridine38-40 synthase